MEGLGRVFDIAPVIMAVDSQTAAMTGFPVSLENATGVTFVLLKDQGAAGDDPVLTFREAKDGSGTLEQDLDVVTSYHSKTNTDASALSGNETWTKFTQTAGDINFDNASAEKGASGEDEALVAVYIGADQLSDDYTHVTMDIADTGAGGAQLLAVIAILHDLQVQRAPENLAASQ